jgi:endo-1,4-beta-mannosidase
MTLQRFYVHGSNNYYMTYSSQTMTNNLLNDAVSMGLNVLRMWGMEWEGRKERARDREE